MSTSTPQNIPSEPELDYLSSLSCPFTIIPYTRPHPISSDIIAPGALPTGELPIPDFYHMGADLGCSFSYGVTAVIDVTKYTVTEDSDSITITLDEYTVHQPISSDITKLGEDDTD